MATATEELVNIIVNLNNQALQLQSQLQSTQQENEGLRSEVGRLSTELAQAQNEVRVAQTTNGIVDAIVRPVESRVPVPFGVDRNGNA